ncbi:54S ribosomal protein L23, mitochondrial [Ceratobasidium sp. 394]|nr:54S ribosomal protein L23, mitochondrial [Ceratobasidium sp. 394]
MSQRVGPTALAYARTWHHVDAADRVLGKLAQRIATVLIGKHKPIFDRGGACCAVIVKRADLRSFIADCGDYVCVTNARKVIVTGRKADQIVYRHHTMYPGGLKEIQYKTMMERKPDEIIRQAVSGMLPKNRLRDRRLERLRIFEGPENPLQANIKRRWDMSVARDTM